MRLVCVSVCCCSFIYSNSYQADQRNLFPRRTEHLGLHPSLYLTSLICYYSHELAFVMSNQSCLNELLLLLGDTVYWHVQFPSRNIKQDHNKNTVSYLLVIRSTTGMYSGWTHIETRLQRQFEISTAIPR